MGGLVAVAAVVAILALTGVLSGGDDDEATQAVRPVQTPAAEETVPEPQPAEAKPRLTTVRVGGRPTAVAAGRGGVWVADSFERRAIVLESEAPDARPTTFNLDGLPTDVTAIGGGAYYALPEQRAVERRELADPAAPGEVIGLDGFPFGAASVETSVWALSDRSVEVIEAETGDVTDELDLDGFASSLAFGEGAVWVVQGNREVARLDPASGEQDGDPVEVQEAFGVTTGEGAAWVVSASGALTRIDPGSLEATLAPTPVRGAHDVAAGFGSVWVTSSRRTVSRLDPRSMKPIGRPLPVGDEPASIAVGEEAVWVANGGDGTLTRIEP